MERQCHMVHGHKLKNTNYFSMSKERTYQATSDTELLSSIRSISASGYVKLKIIITRLFSEHLRVCTTINHFSFRFHIY